MILYRDVKYQNGHSKRLSREILQVRLFATRRQLLADGSYSSPGIHDAHDFVQDEDEKIA